MSAFIHPQAICEGEIGDGTRVWAFAHVLPGAKIGANCNICDGVFVEGDVVVGDDVTVKCGVQLWNGVRLENGVFVGPNATFSNDRFPRSRRPPEAFAVTTVKAGASIGANATILPGLTIGHGAMVGAGSVVTVDLPAKAVAVGNPARIVGYADADTIDPGATFPADFPARLISLGGHVNALGRLSVAETSALPFVPQRLFMVDSVPSGRLRGSHAHRACDQILIATAGSVTAAVDDGRRAFVVRLDRPDRALFMPHGLWGSQFGYSADATLLVLASAPFDRADYIFDYGEFVALTAGAMTSVAGAKVALPEIGRFAAAGLGNTLLTILVYQAAVSITTPLQAYVLAWCVGIGLVMLVYPKLVFQREASLLNGLVMGVVYIVAFGIGCMITALCTWLQVPDRAIIIVTAAVTSVVSYTGGRWAGRWAGAGRGGPEKP